MDEATAVHDQFVAAEVMPRTLINIASVLFVGIVAQLAIMAGVTALVVSSLLAVEVLASPSTR